tara:strand:+ start:45 stop:665 length:621 start_codon:yes stop_codon:yes gene_type:complete
VIPERLVELSKYANTQKFEITERHKDGRQNSAEDEEKLTELLAKKYPIDVPEARAWYDFAITDDGIFYPVNIKSTTGKGNDNLSCKLGIYYALTGKNPTGQRLSGWRAYFDKLNADLSENDADYYFLVLNKGTGKTFMAALKGLQSLVPNGNNLPFQCNWTENTQYKSRTFEEAKDFLLSNFAKSIRGRTAIGDDFKDNFPSYSQA